MNAADKESARLLYQAAADLIRADLEATTDLRWPLLIEDGWWDQGDLAFSHGSSDQGLYRVPTQAELADAITRGDVPPGRTIMGMLAAELADRANEDVMEQLERPWPECPVHHRPMDPTPVGLTGTWQCSRDAAHAAPIGGLAGMVGAAGLLEFT